MSIENIQLRKLLKLMFLDGRKRRSALRRDIREERNKQIARETGERDEGGGDFYSPFWADVRSHVFGTADLHTTVRDRIGANGRRSSLYPQLRDGFLRWWTERRRWTNEPFRQGRHLRSHLDFTDLQARVKVDSVLSVRDANGVEHYIYPYFFPEPAITNESARLGLWVLTQAFNDVPPDEMRILDVIRGRTFSIDRSPLLGNEEEEFRGRYRRLIEERDALLSEDE
ncbi:hypothetical protein [Phyllobacterium leguminum]|uniref:Uncharacterized protein n=1 Tax=Phyllobacterium leguminum TaxID=314237 RepID=A0A318T2C5_9HYPH|nr:hypothetical protein [Phyllobacterium leguminum]PYE88052.1 hypothetical protein C7477_10996 [Phyllobacterium leguminum]